MIYWDFPGGPVVKTLCFQCRGHGFDPWSWNKDPTCHAAWPEIIIIVVMIYVGYKH